MFKKVLFLILSLSILSSCDQQKLEPTETESYYESYRVYLWTKLIWNHWYFDFVGTQYDDYQYPGIRNDLFDRNHEGVPGIESEEVLDKLDLVLQLSQMPDVVLLGIGGNDLANGKTVKQTVQNVNKIIDKIQNHNPGVIIFVEQIAPPKTGSYKASFFNKLVNYNSAIAYLAMLKSTGISHVIPVDMYTNWDDTFLSDDVHYSVLGAKEVADGIMKVCSKIYRNTGRIAF